MRILLATLLLAAAACDQSGESSTSVASETVFVQRALAGTMLGDPIPGLTQAELDALESQPTTEVEPEPTPTQDPDPA